MTGGATKMARRNDPTGCSTMVASRHDYYSYFQYSAWVGFWPQGESAFSGMGVAKDVEARTGPVRLYADSDTNFFGSFTSGAGGCWCPGVVALPTDAGGGTVVGLGGHVRR